MYKIQELHPQYVTNETGQKIAVLLPIKVFEEMVEDLTDMAAIIDRQDESTVSHEELIKKLKKMACYKKLGRRATEFLPL